MSGYVQYVFIAILIVLIFVMFRNSRKKRAEQQALQSKMQPGTEVMLTFGLYGTLVSIDEENNIAEVEVSPGNVVKVHRQTLGRVVEPVVADDAATSTTAGGAVGDAVVVEPTESTSSYSLNEDHAIPSSEPDFGERIDTTSTRDADKRDS
jgi:preprotein translocase subunit YajC